jgi:repressor LexA
MPITLYRRQRQIVDYIAQYIQLNGTAPTLQEIANVLKVTSLATVHEHIQSLVKKGVIKKYSGTVRGMEIVDERYQAGQVGVTVPILGYIAAGKPIEPYTDPNATFGIPSTMVSSKKRSFVLQVKGDSMIEDGILDGDYVVIEETDFAENGDIVVALLENGLATLKRFFKETTRVRLEPANSKMAPIYATNVRIQGKCIGVIRRFNSIN